MFISKSTIGTAIATLSPETPGCASPGLGCPGRKRNIHIITFNAEHIPQNMYFLPGELFDP